MSDVAEVTSVESEPEVEETKNEDSNESESETPETDTDETDSGEDSGEEDEEESSEDSEEVDEDDEVEVDENLYQQLKKVDAKIFNKVPELKHIVFQHQEYTKHFSSVDDARQAAEIVDTFHTFEKDLLSGKSEGIIKTLGDTNKKSLENFVANFAPTLKKENKDLYFGMIHPIIKDVLRAAARHSDQRMKISAENLNLFLYGDTDLNKNEGLSPKNSDEDDELSKREKAFNEKIANAFESDVNTSATAKLRSFISKEFKDSGIPQLQQKYLITEIFEKVDEKLKNDTTHMSKMSSLWKQAERAGWTTEWKDRIKFAYLSRAKVYISKVRQGVLSEAKLLTKAKEGKEVKRVPSSNMSAGKVNGKVDPKKVDWSKTTEQQYLQGQITYLK